MWPALWIPESTRGTARRTTRPARLRQRLLGVRRWRHLHASGVWSVERGVEGTWLATISKGFCTKQRKPKSQVPSYCCRPVASVTVMIPFLAAAS